ncbi:Histone-lysine N-methyltransferase ehmt1, variant 2 [Balamuthia mandrillaris]
MEQQKKEEEKAIPPTVSPYAEARKSGVHGFGLFATQNIPRDTRIIEYIGPKIKESQWRCLSWEDMCYTHRLDEEWLIDGSVSYNTARFINHSCDPNCSSDVWSEKGRIFIYSNRLILQGEELRFVLVPFVWCWLRAD